MTLTDYMLTVNSPSELPANLFRFYDGLTTSEQVISLSPVGQNYVQAINKEKYTGLFCKDFVPNDGEMYLSYEKHSPLFIIRDGKITVIAPCEVQEA